MSGLQLNSIQVAIAALIPKKGAITAERISQLSTLPLESVVANLYELAAHGLVLFDPESREYRLAGEDHAG